MEYEILELEGFSGRRARIYSVILKGEEIPLFEKFVQNYLEKYPNEIDIVLAKVEEMGNFLGAREHFFEEEADFQFQSKFGKGYFLRISQKGIGTIRVYCLRLAIDALILFDGGIKPSDRRTWQSVPELQVVVERALRLSKCILGQLSARTLKLDPQTGKLIGQLRTSEYDEDE